MDDYYYYYCCFLSADGVDADGHERDVDARAHQPQWGSHWNLHLPIAYCCYYLDWECADDDWQGSQSRAAPPLRAQ